MRVFNAGNIPENVSALKQMADNYLAGHRQKIRRRLRLLEEFCYKQRVETEISMPDTSHSESITAIQRNVTPSQWELLESLANGSSYQELSAERGLPTGSVKSSISRIRKRLRCLIRNDDVLSIAA